MSTRALQKSDLALLDFLCRVKVAGHIRIKELKPWASFSIRRLSRAGLVEGFEPTPWAFHDWQQNQIVPTEEHRLGEEAAPVEKPTARPRPTGAQLAREIDAFLEAHPDVSKSRVAKALFGFPGGIDRIRVKGPVRSVTARKVETFLANPPLDELRRQRPARNPVRPDTQGASGTARKAPGAASSGAASRGLASAPPPSIVDIKVNETPEPKPRRSYQPTHDWSKPPPGYEVARPGPVDLTEAVISRAQAKQAPVRNKILDAAQKRIDEGKGVGGTKLGVHVRIAQRSLLDQAERERIANDPVEQAKTVLRRRYSPVVSVEFLDPPGRKGFYRVGTRTVSEAELLAMAEAMRR